MPLYSKSETHGANQTGGGWNNGGEKGEGRRREGKRGAKSARRNAMGEGCGGVGRHMIQRVRERKSKTRTPLLQVCLGIRLPLLPWCLVTSGSGSISDRSVSW